MWPRISKELHLPTSTPGLTEALTFSMQGPVMYLRTQEDESTVLSLIQIQRSRQKSKNVEQRRTRSPFLHQKTTNNWSSKESTSKGCKQPAKQITLHDCRVKVAPASQQPSQKQNDSPASSTSTLPVCQHFFKKKIPPLSPKASDEQQRLFDKISHCVKCTTAL